MKGAMKANQQIQTGSWTIGNGFVTRLLVAALLVTAAFRPAFGTCYVTPEGPDCATNQIASCTNGCVSMTYYPSNSTYCDSHDGACGKLECTPTDTQMWLLMGFGQCDIDGNCGSFTVVGPLAGGTCSISVLSGDKCGFCPE